MGALEILERLSALGVSITLVEDRLRLSPGSRIPPELLADVCENKPDLVALLKAQGGSPPKPYRLLYGERPSREEREAELVEIGRRLREYGYVLLWSNVVEDLVAFYRGEEALKKIPPGFVPYSEAELLELRKTDPSDEERRTIHQAKKLGGIIKEITNDGQL